MQNHLFIRKKEALLQKQKGDDSLLFWCSAKKFALTVTLFYLAWDSTQTKD